MRRKNIMISYGRKDASDFVVELRDILVQKGYDVWIDRSKDEYGIKGGTEWEDIIEEAIKNHHIILAVLSPHAIRRPDGVCLDEISMARFENKFIIPLMYKEVKPPLCIFRLDWIDFLKFETQDALKDRALNKLFQSIENNKLDYEGRNKAFNVLRSINFDARLTALKEGFIGREWIYKADDTGEKSEISRWLKSKKKVLLLLGDPGIGKSAISAYLIEKHPSCVAYHFCMAEDEDTLDPIKFIKSITHQLATQMDEAYADLVLAEIAELPASPVSLFRTLIANPLSQLSTMNDKQFFIVIDGLDEASKLGSKNELLMLFSSKFIDALPANVRFVFTSRDNEDIKSRFSRYEPFEILASDERNKKDLDAYVLKICNTCNITLLEEEREIILKKSEGNILYLKEIFRQSSQNNIINMDELPLGLDGIYIEYFDNTFGDMSTYEPYRKLISLLVSLCVPVNLDFLEILLGSEVRKQFLQIKPYFPIDADGNILAFHKSLYDWLKKNDNQYGIDEYDGHETVVMSGKLDFNNINEFKLYLYSAVKLLLKKQNLRDVHMDRFYEDKISNIYLYFECLSEEHSFVKTVKSLIESDPGYSKYDCNIKMLEHLKQVLAVKKQEIESSNLKNLFEQDKLKWAEDYVSHLNSQADTYVVKKEKAKAIDIKTKVLDIMKGLYELDPVRWSDDYLKSLIGLSYLYRYGVNVKKSIELAESSVEQYMILYDDNAEEWAEGYIHALNNLAFSYEASNRYSESSKILERVISLTYDLFKQNPSRWGELYFYSLRDLAIQYENMNEYSNATAVNEQSLKIVEQLYEYDHDKWGESYIVALINLAYSSLTNIDRRIQILENSLGILVNLYENNPKRWREYYSNILGNLAASYLKIGRKADAKRIMKEQKIVEILIK